MVKNILSFFLSIILVNGFSQNVTTLVTGPSGFNDGLVQDSLGNIYASYYYGTVVTKITPNGQTNTYVGGLTDPNGLTFTPEGELLIPEATANKITLIDSVGNKTPFAIITNPSGLYYLPDGRLLVAQYNQDKVSVIDTNGVISNYWTGIELSGGPVGIFYDSVSKEDFVGLFDNGKILKRDSLGVVTELADLQGWCGFIAVTEDYVYATAFTIHKIYRIARDGSTVEVIAGSGARGQADSTHLQSSFDNPNGIIVSSDGDTLYVSDYGTRSLRVISGVNSIVINTIKEDLREPDVSIWPNPSHDFIQIYANIFEKNASFTLTDVSGRLLFDLNKSVQKMEDNTFRINLPKEITSGMYVLTISSSDFTQSTHFLVE